MGTEFNPSPDALIIDDWVENDETGGDRSCFFVAPFDLTLVRLRFTTNATVTTPTYVIQKNGLFVGGASGASMTAGTSSVVEVEGNPQFTNLDNKFQKGDGLEIVLPAGSQDYQVSCEFRRGI